MITRPLLSGSISNLSDIKYPVWATPKLDGIRILKVGGQIVTRKFKPLPNKDVKHKLEFILPDGIDGEILLRHGTFNDVQSQIMSQDGEPDYIFYAFDYVKDNLDVPYLKRIEDLRTWYNDLLLRFIALTKLPFNSWTIDPENFKDKIRLLEPIEIKNETELLQYEESCLSLGYEGVMLRAPNGVYKCGRSTNKEGILLKLKRFKDAEAIIIGFEEKLHNSNSQTTDPFGLAKRSHQKAGLVPAHTLGSLLVRDISTGIEFGIGTGFDDALKNEIWQNQDQYINKIVKYKYQAVGTKDAPRFPVFLGVRHADDL